MLHARLGELWRVVLTQVTLGAQPNDLRHFLEAGEHRVCLQRWFEGVDNLAGIQNALRIERVLDALQVRADLRTDLLLASAQEEPHGVLARVAAAVLLRPDIELANHLPGLQLLLKPVRNDEGGV